MITQILKLACRPPAGWVGQVGITQMREEKYKDILNDLISEELNSGRIFQFTVSTPSMLPLIKPADKIKVRKDSSERLKSGDIVVFEKYRQLYTHRLLRKEMHNSKTKLITKGDNALIIDAPVSVEELLGKVIGIERNNKSIDLECKSWKIINRLAAGLSYLEWIIYNALRNFKRKILPYRRPQSFS